MNRDILVIRVEKQTEQRAVENLVRECFWNVYRPGCMEHFVLHELRKSTDFIPELNLVMEKNNQLIGQATFVKAKVQTDYGTVLSVLSLGPICILPEFQKMGYGKYLLDKSLEKAEAAGYGAVCLEGNIDFYGKSGFKMAKNYQLRYHGMPEEEAYDFFLCKELTSGYLTKAAGEYSVSHAYMVDEKDVEIFDSQFTPKPKLKLPGQLF